MFLPNAQVSQLLENLHKDGVNLLMIAEETDIDISAFISKASEGGFTIAGGIFPRVIEDGDHHTHGVILKHVVTESKPTMIQPISEIVADFQLPTLSESTKSCLIFLDGLMQEIPRFLEYVYGQYWNTVNYVGGGAGSLSLRQSPCIFSNEGLFQDAALIIPCDCEAHLGVNHGWVKTAGPFVANKTEGNKILELNWRPAFEVYSEVVEPQSERKFDDADFFEISKGFPFGIHREDAEDIVRDPIAVDEEGALICVGAVSANTSLNILSGNNESLLEGASKASKQAMVGATAKDLLLVDCISRVLYLEDDFEQELARVKKEIRNVGASLPVEGVLSIGEISSGRGGFLELYNKTIVVAAFQ